MTVEGACAELFGVIALTCSTRTYRTEGRQRQQASDMNVQLNHTIIWCYDKQRSAMSFTEFSACRAPKPFGLFLVVELSNGVSLDFYEIDGEIASQHYAFLIGEDDFDQIFGGCIRERRLEHWADPGQHQPSEINRNDGGRGAYFEDPDGHLLEIITRPYGSGREIEAQG